MPAVFPAALLGDGLEHLGSTPHPFSDACARSPSASSRLACAMNLSLACRYCWVVNYGSSVVSHVIASIPVGQRCWCCLTMLECE